MLRYTNFVYLLVHPSSWVLKAGTAQSSIPDRFDKEEPMSLSQPLIIDCHGHFTTAPKALEDWRNQQIDGIKDPAKMPKASDLKISDDDLREAIETNQLKLMKERGSDLTLFSPRASFMAHHIGDFQVSSTWAAICNELVYRVSQLFPQHFVPVAMLPQSPGVDPATCIPELEKCVKEYGAVGINLNPDPSGGHWTSPPLSDRHWYPIYEKMVEYDLPAMIHVSTSCNACFHTTGAHYINADTTAFMQLIQGDLFKDFPTLKFVVPHGGGAAPYHWGRYRGLAQELKKPLLADQIAVNYRKADITPRQRAMLDFAFKVTTASHLVDESDFAALRAHGFDDEDAWDIGAISAFFGLSNRMANLSGMQPNEQFYLMGRVPKPRF